MYILPHGDTVMHNVEESCVHCGLLYKHVKLFMILNGAVDQNINNNI